MNFWCVEIGGNDIFYWLVQNVHFQTHFAMDFDIVCLVQTIVQNVSGNGHFALTSKI